MNSPWWWSLLSGRVVVVVVTCMCMCMCVCMCVCVCISRRNMTGCGGPRTSLRINFLLILFIISQACYFTMNWRDQWRERNVYLLMCWCFVRCMWTNSRRAYVLWRTWKMKNSTDIFEDGKPCLMLVLGVVIDISLELY